MVYLSIYEKLNKNQLQALWIFCRKHANFISLSIEHMGFLSDDQFMRIQNEMKEALDDYLVEIGNDFNTNKGESSSSCGRLAITTEKELKEYLKNMKKQNSSFLHDVKRKGYQGDGLDIQLLNSHGMVKMRTTRITPVTMGTITDMCFFHTQCLEKEFNDMSSLFDFPIEVNGYEFEDPAFYRKNFDFKYKNILLSVNSHERYSSMWLTENELKEFEQLKIPFVLEEMQFD